MLPNPSMCFSPLHKRCLGQKDGKYVTASTVVHELIKLNYVEKSIKIHNIDSWITIDALSWL